MFEKKLKRPEIQESSGKIFKADYVSKLNRSLIFKLLLLFSGETKFNKRLLHL